MRKLRLVGLALVVAALLPALGIAGTAQTTISIGARTSHHPVGGLTWATAGTAATISGDTGDGQAGTAVELQASKFPFSSGFATVGQTMTATGGSYAFTAQPALATRYRVALVSDTTSQSAVVTVYVTASGTSHTRGRCATGAPTCHLRFSGHLLYPAAVAKREGAKRAYYYFGVRYGSETTPPTRVRLVQTGHQQRHGHQYWQSFSVTFRTPGPFYYQWETCTKDSEARDGLGLPGHHHCGDRSIPESAIQQGYIG